MGPCCQVREQKQMSKKQATVDEQASIRSMELKAAPQVPRRDAKKLVKCRGCSCTPRWSRPWSSLPARPSPIERPAPPATMLIVLSPQVVAAVASCSAFALPPALEQPGSIIKRQHAKKQAAALDVAATRRPGWFRSVPSPVATALVLDADGLEVPLPNRANKLVLPLERIGPRPSPSSAPAKSPRTFLQFRQ
ncbi:hypothetical protein ACQJBY_022037 [Aegilops geniculata]